MAAPMASHHWTAEEKAALTSPILLLDATIARRNMRAMIDGEQPVMLVPDGRHQLLHASDAQKR